MGKGGRVQFFEELDSAVVGFWGCSAAFFAAFGNALGFQGVEFGEVVVEFDPVIPVHCSEAHCYVVGAIFERAIWLWFCCVDIPVWIRRSCGTFEIDGFPYSCGALGSFEIAGSS